MSLSLGQILLIYFAVLALFGVAAICLFISGALYWQRARRDARLVTGIEWADVLENRRRCAAALRRSQARRPAA